MMAHAIAKTIEAYFREHEGDGDFLPPAREDAYRVANPACSSGAVIYARKTHIALSAIRAADKTESMGFIGRPSLPSHDDLRWIQACLGANRLLFLGDLDSSDLLVYAWLRQSLPHLDVRYLGISDDYLQKLHVEVRREFLLPAAHSESDALPLLQNALPGYPQLLGDDCSQILGSGQKMELEAVAGHLDSPASLISDIALP